MKTIFHPIPVPGYRYSTSAAQANDKSTLANAPRLPLDDDLNTLFHQTNRSTCALLVTATVVIERIVNPTPPHGSCHSPMNTRHIQTSCQPSSPPRTYPHLQIHRSLAPPSSRPSILRHTWVQGSGFRVQGLYDSDAPPSNFKSSGAGFYLRPLAHTYTPLPCGLPLDHPPSYTSPSAHDFFPLPCGTPLANSPCKPRWRVQDLGFRD